MISLQSAIDAVIRVMTAMPIEFVMSDECPMDDLMHALTTIKAVEAERIRDAGGDAG